MRLRSRKDSPGAPKHARTPVHRSWFMKLTCDTRAKNSCRSFICSCWTLSMSSVTLLTGKTAVVVVCFTYCSSASKAARVSPVGVSPVDLIQSLDMPKNASRGMPFEWKNFPRRQDSNGRWLCKRCGTVLAGRKEAWCGKECLKAVLLLVHWPRMRQFILRRDKRTCQICGLPGREVDHIIEVQDGGRSTESNLWVLCHRDHVAKTGLIRRLRARKAALPAKSGLVALLRNQ